MASRASYTNDTPPAQVLDSSQQLAYKALSAKGSGNMTELAQLLKQQFDPHKAADLDITVAFDCAGQQTCVGIHHGQATFYCSPQMPTPELVIYFRDETLARNILTGKANPVQAFMASEFRSNGYIIWTFQTLAAFSKSAA